VTCIIKLKTTSNKNNKARLLTARLCYIDGLVSTGNQIPYTILKRNFPNQKIFPEFFINIFFCPVDKEHFFSGRTAASFLTGAGHSLISSSIQ